MYFENLFKDFSLFFRTLHYFHIIEILLLIIKYYMVNIFKYSQNYATNFQNLQGLELLV